MKLHNKTADVFIPDGLPPEAALARTTHMGIGAHQDDLEIMAFHGILQCYDRRERWFAGVTCTNGAGSPRAGAYATWTDEQMRNARREEQRSAATIGQYGAMIQLDYPSSALKQSNDARPVDDLVEILAAARPEVLYTHNPADKHGTHVAVCSAVIRALRRLPEDARPRAVYGCETWRDLDWLPDGDKIALDVGGQDNLAASLLGVFDTQIAGGKRYDLATLARRTAHATFFESHAVDAASQLTFAMDLTPLARDDRLDMVEYVSLLIERFEADVRSKLSAFRV